VRVALTVPDGGPLFEGHFPGRPILPGVAALAMICDAISPRGASVRWIRSVRFRDLIAPGTVLDVSTSDGGDSLVRFEATREGKVVVNGTVAFGEPDHAEAAGFAVAARPVRLPAPLDALLPHRLPMRLVEAVLGEADDGATCLARIPAASGFARGGVAPALTALEAAAQTAAVWEVLRRLRDGGPGEARLGYLVSIRDVTLCRTTVPVEGDLFASVKLEAAAPPLSHYAAEVVCEGAIVLRGTIGTYLTA